MCSLKNFDEILEKYRQKIDCVDENIIKLLNERFSYSLKIAAIKHKNSCNVVDFDREHQILNKIRNLSEPKFEETNTLIYSLILMLSSKIQFM